MILKGKMLDEHNNIKGLQGGKTDASGKVTEAYHLTQEQANNIGSLISNPGISDASSDGKTYARKNGAWIEITTGDGLTDAPNDNKLYGRKNKAWSEVDALTDANSDGKTYARKDGAWTEITTGDGLTDAPNDGKLYGRQNKAWSEVAIPAAVTIVDDLTTGGSNKALSAEQGKVLNNSIDTKVQAKYDDFGHWGIAYTIDTYDSDDNPTQITFADGVVLTLTYNSNGQATQAVYTKGGTTLKTATLSYDSNDRLISYSLV